MAAWDNTSQGVQEMSLGTGHCGKATVGAGTTF